MRNLPSLKALQAFEAASRLGSFVTAAEELLVTPSAISHQVRALERELGVTLFHRVHRSIVLTDLGRRYAEQIAETFGAIETATRSIARSSKSDILTIHVVPSLAAQWLMPRLSRFSSQNPDVDVRVNASVAPVDLATGEADLDIRYGTVFPTTGVAVVPFPEETVLPLCSPALMHGDYPIRTPADLRHHTLIHSEVNLISWGDWLKWAGAPPIDLARGPRFDRSFMAISSAVDSVGVCLESHMLVQRELASGQLVAPFGMEGPKISGHSLMFMKSRARLPKIRLFQAWLFRELGHEGPVPALDEPGGRGEENAGGI